MSIETVRISKQGRDHLSRLKRRTGIGQWNILCRWALCVSLAESGRPRPVQGGERPIEMTWKTFGGDHADVYLALLKERCHQEGLGTNEGNLSEQLHAHIHRGIGYLSGEKSIANIEGLIRQGLARNSDEQSPCQ